MPIENWQPGVIEERALRVAELRMAKATVVLQSAVKQKLNRSNSKGRNPSAPGEPPRKGTGDLQNSIFAEVRRLGKVVTGFVGSRLRKARRLELGFVGKDSLGRTIDQKPRPFLRPAFMESRERLKKILGGK